VALLGIGLELGLQGCKLREGRIRVGRFVALAAIEALGMRPLMPSVVPAIARTILPLVAAVAFAAMPFVPFAGVPFIAVPLLAVPPAASPTRMAIFAGRTALRSG
jgi:hypothetical protein